jgi:hypothetical protein
MRTEVFLFFFNHKISENRKALEERGWERRSEGEEGFKRNLLITRKSRKLSTCPGLDTCSENLKKASNFHHSSTFGIYTREK